MAHEAVTGHTSWTSRLADRQIQACSDAPTLHSRVACPGVMNQSEFLWHQCDILLHPQRESKREGERTGAPQGSIPGPISLLLYINHQPKGLTSRACLVTDDAICHKDIDVDQDQQKDMQRRPPLRVVCPGVSHESKWVSLASAWDILLHPLSESLVLSERMPLQ